MTKAWAVAARLRGSGRLERRAQGLLAAGRQEEAQIEMAQFLARRRENET
jgi:hypothetical protein